MTEINVKKKSLAGQISLTDTLEPMKPLRVYSTACAIAHMCIGVLLTVGLLAVIHACEQKPKPVSGEVRCYDCHRRQAFTQYFKKAGSSQPERMADAVLNTNTPRLLAAISKVESGGNPHIRRAGYKKRHDGAFQVNPRHWGKVPHDAVDQALQAEAIIVELTATMPIEKALSLYGGDSTSRYQKRVLAELTRVP